MVYIIRFLKIRKKKFNYMISTIMLKLARYEKGRTKSWTTFL